MSEDKLNIHQRLNVVRNGVERLTKENQAPAQAGGYKYISHDQVTQAIRPLLVENGVGYSATTSEHELIPELFKTSKGPEAGVRVVMTLLFVSTDDAEDAVEISTVGLAPLNGGRGYGSAESYAVKYGLQKMFLMDAGDEDLDAQEVAETNRVHGKANGSTAQKVSGKSNGNGNARYERFKKACEANSIPLMEAVKKAEDQFAAKPSELTDTAFETLITWIEGAGELNQIMTQEDAA